MRSVRPLVLVAVLTALVTLFVRERVFRAPLKEEAVVTEFFKLYHGRAIHRTTFWAGVPIQQTPTDMWMIQQIVTETKPDFLIETGTLKGGSALYYASILQGLDLPAKVITVDIADQLDRARDIPAFRSRVIPIIGDSVAPDTIRKIEDLVQGRPALVLLDSYHRKDHVLRELRLYARFVPVGSYMVVFDTDLNGHPVSSDYGPGPMEAVEEFLATDDRFVADASRERFLLTMCPNGYLKRVK